MLPVFNSYHVGFYIVSFFRFLYRRSSAIILLVFHSHPVLDHWATLCGGVYPMSIFIGAAYRIRTHSGATQTTSTDALTTSATSTPLSCCHFMQRYSWKYIVCIKSLKPIFHQNAKYLASGVGVGQCTRRQNFALPNAKYTNMLVYFALADAHFLLYPTPTPRRQSVEYRWRWVPTQNSGVGHVHFFFFV